jgi:hypothetical protein
MLIIKRCKSFIRQKYYGYIRKHNYIKAAAIKNWLSITGLLIGFIWLFFWGAELVHSTSELPYVKLATIMIAYATTIPNIWYSYKFIRIRTRHHRKI